MASDSSKFVLFGALACNAAIAVAKLIAAVVSGSSAIWSEAIHSFVDTGDSFLLLLGRHRAAKPADQLHPFGHGREIYFWSFLVAILIFGVGGGLSILEGVRHLLRPAHIERAIWGYCVLGVAAIFEAISFTIGWREFLRRKRAEQSLWRTFRSIKEPSVFTVVLEDAAALVGLALAFVGLLLHQWLGWEWADGLSSVLIGCVLMLVAVVLVYQCKSLLIGESVDPKQAERIRQIILADEAVADAGYPLTMYVAPHEVLLNANVCFRADLPAAQMPTAVNRLEGAIRREFPDVKRMFIEAESIGEICRESATSACANPPGGG